MPAIFLIFLSLFLSLFSASTATNQKAKDIERETDIKAMHGQVESYYAQYGKYPTFANMNDETWRSSNLKGLDNEALVDPDGSDPKLDSSPGKGRYSYEVSGSNNTECDNQTVDCAAYTLTATLDDGGTFTKTNLN